MKKPSARAIARQRRLNAKRGAPARGRRNFRLQAALAPAAVLMAGAFGGGQALAGTTTLNTNTDYTTSTVQATGHIVIDTTLVNSGGIAIEASSLNVLNQSQINTDGTGTGLSVDVDGNVVAAIAAGNSFENEIDLNLIDSTVGEPFESGVGAISYALNRDTSVRSEVDASGFDQINVDVDDGTFTVSDNFVLAQTSLNLGVNTIAGQVPTGFSDDSSPGSMSFAFPTTSGDNDLETSATIAVSSHQLNFNSLGQSSALATDNFATLLMDGSTNLPLEATLQVDGNEFASSLRGNVVDTVIPLQAGGNPAFVGTVALASIQGNVQDGGGVGLARTAGTEVSGTVQDHTLDGTLSVSSNAISSFGRGNDSLNAIELENGLSYQGADTAVAPSASLVTAVGPDSLNANVGADLGLLNVQGNRSVSIAAVTEDSTVRGQVNRLDGASVQVDLNRVSASASGSVGNNRIVGEQANSFQGSAALVSSQINQDPDAGTDLAISATVAGTAVDALIGDGTGILQDSTVTVVGTGVLADATGNRVTNEVGLAGNTLALGNVEVDGVTGDVSVAAAPGSLTGGQEGVSNMVGSAGALLLNVQAGYSVDTTASITGTSVGIDASDNFAGSGLAENITGSSLQVSDTAVDASAMGNRAANTLSLNANALTGSAMLGSVQALDAGGNVVSATVTDAEIGVLAGQGDIELLDSSVNVNDNLVRGRAFGNRASSAVQITANGATLPVDGGGFPASQVDFNIAGADQQINAAYGLLGVQSSSQDVVTTVDAIRIGTEIGDAASTSQINVTGNAVVGAAFGNEGFNAMALDLNNLAFADTDATGAVATVTSAQETTGDVTSRVGEIDAPAVAPGLAAIQIGGGIDGALTDSTLSVTDNFVQSEAVGNLAAANGELGNTLTVTGTNIAAMPAAPLDGISVDSDGITADTMFSVVNAQRFLGDADLTADLGGVLFATAVNGPVVDSTVSLNRNVAAASGTLNQAFNMLDMSDITSLESAAGLVSDQQTVGGADVLVENVGILAQSGPVTGSTVEVSENFTQARARSNVALNWVSIDATNVTTPGFNGVNNITVDGSDLDVTAAFTNLNVQETIGDVQAGLGNTRELLSVGGDVTSSTTSLDANVFSAAASANTATNALEVSAANLNAAPDSPLLGLLSSQTTVGDVDADIADATRAVVVDGSAIDSSVSLSENFTQARARGNEATNMVSLEGTNLSLPANEDGGDARPNTINFAAEINAAVASANVQAMLFSNVGASISGETLNEISIGGDVDGSSVSLNDNFASASAQANTATSDLLLSANQISQVGEGPVAAVVNDQAILLFSSVESRIEAEDLAVIDMGAVDQSSVSASDNTFLAEAFGNRAETAGLGNRLRVEGGSILTPGEYAGLDRIGETTITADAALVIQNSQFTDASVTASVAPDVGDGLIRIAAGDAVTDSTVAADGNVISATAGANRARTALELLDLNAVQTTGIVGNLQVTDEQPVTAAVDSGIDLNVAAGGVSDSTLSIAENLFLATATVNSGTNRLTVEGNTVTSGTTALGGATPESRWVTLDGGSAPNGDDTRRTLQGDFLLSNVQFSVSPVIATGETSLNIVTDGGVSGSTLNLRNNIQEVRASGNVADSALAISATNLGTDTEAGASSSQFASQEMAGAGALAEATLDGTITGGVSESSVRVDLNQNRAVATGNDMATRTTIEGTNLRSSGAADENAVINRELVGTVDQSFLLRADHSVAQIQTLTPSQDDNMVVASTAETDLANHDATGSLSDSSVSFSRNLTEAVSVGNRARGRLTLDGSTVGTTGSVFTEQLSGGTSVPGPGEIRANATSDLLFALDADGAPGVTTNSTVDVSGNATVASATVNQASNVLEVLASSSYQGVSGVGASANILGATGVNADRSSDVSATFAVLNRQENRMNATSVAEARHNINLADGDVTGASLNVTGNEVRAEANGNFAVNQVSMSSRPGGNGSAVIGSRQQNQGNLSATVSNSRFGINVSGANTSSSTASVSGNRGIASSTGNTAVNRITSTSGGGN
jgi:hypothetical protein